MRVATYARTATDSDPGTLSMAHQRRRLRQYVADHHDELVVEFSDSGTGGLAAPGLRRAVCEAQAGRFDTLLVTHADRLASRITTLREAVEALAATGIAVRSLSSPYTLTSPPAMFLLRAAAAMADAQCDDDVRSDGERTRAGFVLRMSDR